MKISKRIFRTFSRFLPDSVYLKLHYRRKMKKKLNLRCPQTFNEKMQWLKLYDRKPFYSTLVDKYAVKQYVSNIIGEKYLIPTLGVWDCFDDIDFDNLPDQFVLKCTHDSGSVKIIRNKNTCNFTELKEFFDKRAKDNYSFYSREWAYKSVKPRIIAEEYIVFVEGQSLVDYKFFCFSGKPMFLYVSTGMADHSTAMMSFYDLEGKELPFHRSDYLSYHNAIMPDNFGEMKQLAMLLAEKVNNSFIRIDLYSNGSTIYFSEFTFFPCGGQLPFAPEEWDLRIGQMIKLPKK